MLNILLIAATEAEIAPLIKYISTTWEKGKVGCFRKNEVNLEVQLCGIGMLATSYYLTKKLQESQYSLVVQAGIAGTYDYSLSLGEVVWVSADRLADLGIENREEYQDVFEIGLVNSNEQPFSDKVLVNPYSAKELGLSDIKSVTALTVNKVTGKKATVDHMRERYNVCLESMEGAALHYVCLQEKIKFLQIRGVSNYVTPRDRSAWKVQEAIGNMNKYLIKYFSDI